MIEQKKIWCTALSVAIVTFLIGSIFGNSVLKVGYLGVAGVMLWSIFIVAKVIIKQQMYNHKKSFKKI